MVKRGKRKRGALTVKEAYERLAFGGISDAVRLLFLEEPGAEELQDMDLFGVSEIRRPRQGGMEIRFFDRIKALECLERMEQCGQEGGSLYDALSESARLLRGEDENAV